MLIFRDVKQDKSLILFDKCDRLVLNNTRCLLTLFEEKE